MQLKFIEEKAVRVLMYVSIAVVAFLVVSVVGSILRRGIPVLSWEMVSQVPSGGFYIGGEGGFLNAIVGSLLIGVVSTATGWPSGAVVFYLNVYLRQGSRWPTRPTGLRRAVWHPLHRLWCLRVHHQVYMGLRARCWAVSCRDHAGGTHSYRSIDEVAKHIPKSRCEASYSLGPHA
jgi:phosphate transport system permease protein